MDPTRQQLLRAIDRALCQKVVPFTTDTNAQRAINAIRLALDELLLMDAKEPGTPDELHRLAALITRGKQLLAASHVAPPPDAWPSRPKEAMPVGLADRELEGLWTQVTDAVSSLLKARETVAHPELQDDIQRFLVDVANVEINNKRRDVLLAPSATVTEQIMDRLEPLTAYFASHLGASDNLAITSARRLAGGFSNETLCVSVSDAGAAPSSFVMRISRPHGINWPFVASLEEEVLFVDLLRRYGVPVPKPLWFESDATLLGAPFRVMEWVRGSLIGNQLRADNQLSNALLANYARALACLHSVPWQEHWSGLPSRFVPASDVTVADSVDLLLRRMREYLGGSWIKPSPVIWLLFDWLERHKPTSTAPAVLTHGDLGFHNWLFEADTPTALLDWELVALCSPTKDLATVRDVVVPAERWEEFLSTYVDAGGVRPVEGDLKYFAVLRQIQAVICTSMASEKMFTVADPLNIDYLELGVTARSYFYLDVLRTLRDIVE
ncbi:MAG: phosphotransferase family protein [Steroidobacteraceae bacterium]